MKKKILLLAIIVVAILVVVYFYIYKGHRDVASATTDYVFTVAQLKQEFLANDSLATTKYQDKVIEVNGKITAIETESKSVVLDEKMYASFDQSIPENVKENQVVKLKGRLLGYDDLLEEFKMDQTSVIE
jgi:uncharacterized protein (UPF0333 family)